MWVSMHFSMDVHLSVCVQMCACTCMCTLRLCTGKVRVRTIKVDLCKHAQIAILISLNSCSGVPFVGIHVLATYVCTYT